MNARNRSEKRGPKSGQQAEREGGVRRHRDAPAGRGGAPGVEREVDRDRQEPCRRSRPASAAPADAAPAALPGRTRGAASSPTTKKKNVIRPLLTHSRRSCVTRHPPTWIESDVSQSDSYERRARFAHTSATTARRPAPPRRRSRCAGTSAAASAGFAPTRCCRRRTTLGPARSSRYRSLDGRGFPRTLRGGRLLRSPRRQSPPRRGSTSSSPHPARPSGRSGGSPPPRAGSRAGWGRNRSSRSSRRSCTIRRCTHGLPTFKHSSQPSIDVGSAVTRIWARWLQTAIALHAPSSTRGR